MSPNRTRPRRLRNAADEGFVADAHHELKRHIQQSTRYDADVNLLFEVESLDAEAEGDAAVAEAVRDWL